MHLEGSYFLKPPVYPHVPGGALTMNPSPLTPPTPSGPQPSDLLLACRFLKGGEGSFWWEEGWGGDLGCSWVGDKQ